MKLFFPHCFMMKSILMKQKVANRFLLRTLQYRIIIIIIIIILIKLMVTETIIVSVTINFSKDSEVTSKNTYRRHIFLAWF